MLVQQSTIPTFETHSSIITQLKNGTVLFCLDYNGERKNFIVTDENGLKNSYPESIQDAFNNGHIKEFGNAQKVNVYHWRLNTSDINTYQNICLYKDVLKDKTKMKVFIGGVEFDDWNFMNRRLYRGSAGTYYTQHLDFSNGYPANETLDIVYREDITDERYSGLLIRSDGSFSKSRDINLTITDSAGNSYYLSDAQITDRFNVQLTYKDFYGNVSDIVVYKKYHDKFYVKEFEIDADMGDKRLEIYSIYPYASGRMYNTDYRSGVFPVLVDFRQYNSVYIQDRHIGTGRFMFRIFDVVSKKYSEFFDEKLLVKKISIFSTDATVSIKNYKGFVFRSTLRKM